MRTLKAFDDKNEVCKMGSHLPSLDFAGLSALIGTNATKAGIPYTCLVRGPVPYLNAYVTAGSLGVAQAVLSCIEWQPARIVLGAGAAGSMLDLCGVRATGNANYVGLQSGTTLPVRGIVGEAVVLELFRKGIKAYDETSKGSNTSQNVAATGVNSCNDLGPARPTYVVWATIGKPGAEIRGANREVRVDGEQGKQVKHTLFSLLATLVCATVLLLDIQCREWVAFSAVVAGMILNALMTFLLRLQKFELAEAHPAPGAPPGDAVVWLKDDPDKFCILRGDEEAIQKLLQKEVIRTRSLLKSLLCNNSSSKPKQLSVNNPKPELLPPEIDMFVVSLALMAYSVFVLLGVPHMGSTAQLLYVIALGFGALTDLMKGSWDGMRGIANEAIGKYEIKVDGVERFDNRTAAVACVANFSTRVDALRRAGLLPTVGIMWKTWWRTLRSLVQLKDELSHDESSDLSTLVEEKLDATHLSDDNILGTPAPSPPIPFILHASDHTLFDSKKTDMKVGLNFRLSKCNWCPPGKKKARPGCCCSCLG